MPVLVALAANLGVAASKFLAYAFTGSSAMLAEGAHSIADTVNQLLLLVGGRRADRSPSPQHPFGYGHFRYLHAFLASVAIFLGGGGFALYEGVYKILNRTPIEAPAWAIGVLLFAGVLEGTSLRTAVRRASPHRGDRGWLQFIKATKAPELAVVLLEDFGALTGLVLALLGVSLTTLTGDGLWDGLATLAIGVLLVSIATLLGRETRSLLLGEAASDDMLDRVTSALLAQPRIRRALRLRTMHLSPEELLVVAQIALPRDSTAADVTQAIAGARRGIRDAVPYGCVIYLEPVLEDGD